MGRLTAITIMACTAAVASTVLRVAEVATNTATTFCVVAVVMMIITLLLIISDTTQD